MRIISLSIEQAEKEMMDNGVVEISYDNEDENAGMVILKVKSLRRRKLMRRRSKQ